ncbi:MAG: hypothetical protein NC899_05195 [Candidatus Omnitrophica bacterium]|nr:hypothetical protein [Candidatus Omnitrophota bacterium]
MKKIVLLSFLLILPLASSQDFHHPILGEVKYIPLIVLGALLGLVDGAFNPCALSVLFFMIAYMLALGSRKKILLIGFSYTLMIFIIYFLFMYGVLKTIYFIGYTETLRKIIGSILIIFGILEIKDFFFYGRGISLEIPKFAKPIIEKLTRAATLPSALLLGIFVSLVEIPCAGAFPFLYASLVAKRVSGGTNTFYLMWYNIFFVVPLIILTLIFYFGLAKIEKAEMKRIEMRKLMRLIAGIILISFGITFFTGWL